jgi:hypothetical protein
MQDAFSSSSSSSSSSAAAGAFKVLDISDMDIVYRGKEWTHAEDPSAKSMVHLLRWNESLVTWLQPKGGTVEDQIPAINVHGKYRTLSLRMQKSIWKHVRLRQGFVNLENLSQGGFKLKIPTMLLCEKERTRHRFAQVCPRPCISSSLHLSATVTYTEDIVSSFFQMRKKEACTKDAQTPRPTAAEASVQKIKEDMGVHPPASHNALPACEGTSSVKKHAPEKKQQQEGVCSSSSSSRRKKARIHPGHDSSSSTTNGTLPASNKSLHKRICHAVTHSVLACVRKDRAFANSSSSRALPTRTCFVVTESDALRKIARDILRRCPKLASSPNRKDLLVKLLELMQEEEEEEEEDEDHNE